MEGNRRAILFALLVTLSSVRGGEFTFYEDAYRNANDLDRASGIDFVKPEKVLFENMNEAHEWVVDSETVREGTTPMRKLIPLNPHLMRTGVKGVENHGQDVEILSYMLMSFHIVDHTVGSISGVAHDHQTAYGKLAMCFQNPRNLLQRETCFYTFMFSRPVELEENRRVILFALLVTLSSVRGGDLTFSESAYRAILNLDRDNGVEFKLPETVHFKHTEDMQEWTVDPYGLIEGKTKIKMFVPLRRGQIRTEIKGVLEHGQNPELLSYMLMSFHVVDHKIDNRGDSGSSSGEANDHQTVYGKLVICFNDPKNIRQPETCFYTFMFSPPEECDKTYAKHYANTLDPISSVQMLEIEQNKPFLWQLGPLQSIFSEMTKAVLKSPVSSSLSSLGIHLQRGESAFYVQPIIVEEALLKEYYAWVYKVQYP